MLNAPSTSNPEALIEKSKIIFPLIRASVPLKTDQNPDVYQNWLRSLDSHTQKNIMTLSSHLMIISSYKKQFELIAAIRQSSVDNTTPFVEFLICPENKEILNFYIGNYNMFVGLNEKFYLYQKPKQLLPMLSPQPRIAQNISEDDVPEARTILHSLENFAAQCKGVKVGSMRRSKSINLEYATEALRGLSIEDATNLVFDDKSLDKKNTLK